MKDQEYFAIYSMQKKFQNAEKNEANYLTDTSDPALQFLKRNNFLQAETDKVKKDLDKQNLHYISALN